MSDYDYDLFVMGVGSGGVRAAEDVFKAASVFLAHRFLIFKEQRGPEEEVVEIEGVAGEEQLLIAGVDLGDDLLAVALLR